MKPKYTNPFFAFAAAASALAFTATSVQALSATWNGTTDSLWATTTNWSTSPVPGVGDAATFNNAGNGNTAITVGNISLLSLLFDTAGAAAYTLGSGSISLSSGGNFTVNSTVTTTQTVNTALALNGGYSFTNNSTTIGQSLSIGGGISSATAGTKALTVNGTGNTTISGNISDGSGGIGLTKNGAGTLTLSGTTNSIIGGDFAVGFSGGNGGTVRIASGASVTTTAASRLLLGLNTGQSGTLVMDSGAGTVTFGGNRGAVANYIGVDGGTGTVNANGGTLNFTGMANGSGHLLIGANSNTSNGTMTVAGGTVNVGTRIQMGSAFPGANAAGWAANGNGNATLTISSGAVNIGTAGAGDTDSDKGVLYLKSPTGGTGTATVNLDGGTLSLARFVIGAGGTSRVVNFNGGTVQARASRTDFLGTGATLNVKDNGAVIDTNNFNITIAGSLLNGGTGVGGLTKNSAGTLTLSSGASSYSGNISITGGTLLATGATGGANPTTSSLGNAQTANRTITVGTGAVLSFGNSDILGNHTSTPVVKLVVNGGTITNNGNFFTTLGAVDLNAGTINSIGGAAAAFPSFSLRGTITVGGSAASTISGSGANSQMVVGGNTAGTQTTFDVANATGDTLADLTVSVPLQNNLNLAGNATVATGIIKTGVGTMTLSNVNTYTGLTTITTGKLTIASAGTINTTSAVSIGAGEFNYNSATPLSPGVSFSDTGGTLSGSATINQAVNVTTGNTLAIGNSVGTMNFGGGLTLGGTFSYEMDGGSNLADLGIVSGMLTLDSSAILDLVQLGTYTLNDRFTLFGYQTGNLTGTFAGLADGALTTDDLGGTWQINYDDTTAGFNGGGTGTSFVTITAIPEPSAALLAALGFLALLRRRR